MLLPPPPAPLCRMLQVGGPAGLSLSSGQAQLVCVARCLLAGAPLVLLDEATAAVDPRTAGLLRQVGLLACLLCARVRAAAGGGEEGSGSYLCSVCVCIALGCVRGCLWWGFCKMTVLLALFCLLCLQ